MFARLKRIAPRRGWRAFVGEVGIIVLGVLIAVGIGKVVEALDWRGRVAATRLALDEDLREGIWPLLAERVLTTPCLERQLDRLYARVLAAPKVPAGTAPPTAEIYHYPARLWDSGVWDSAIADGIPAHMSDDDRYAYRMAYVGIAHMRALNREEFTETADLALLNDPAAIDPTARADLLRVIARERSRIALMDLIARQQIRHLRRSGRDYRLPADEVDGMNTLKWCRANRLA